MDVSHNCLGPLAIRCSVPGISEGGIGLDEDASVSPSTPILPSVSDVQSCARFMADGSSGLALVHDSKEEEDLSVCCILSGDADPSVQFPVDPVVLAMGSSLDEACPESIRFGLNAADLDFSELSSVHPLEPVSVLSPPKASQHQDPSLYPVRSSLSGGPARKLVQSVPFSGFDFGGQSFPPLAKPAGGSKSALISNSGEPIASGGLAASPVVRPVGEENPLTANASWASLVSVSPSLMKLSYFKPTSSSSEGKVSLSLPPEIARIGAAAWETSIVGFFLDKLPFSFVESFARRMWDNKGLVEVLSNGSGFFFFKFSNKAELSGILDGGPWYFGGRPIFLKPWSPGMILSKDGCKKVPIWARFFNVPLEFWTAEGLSRIASIVGSPLHADQMTSSLKRLSYARICLEISIDDPLPNSLDLILEDGRSVEVLIEYSWVPKRCPVCKVFGHLPKNCKKTVRQSWVPKSSLSSAGLSDDAPTLGSKPGSEGKVSTNKASPASKIQRPLLPMANSLGLSTTVGLNILSNAFDPLKHADGSIAA